MTDGSVADARPEGHVSHPALVVDITELKRNPGRQRPFERTIDDLDGVALATSEVIGGTITSALSLEMVGAQLTATGNLTIEWTGPCRRCLESQVGSVTTAVKEIFELSPVEGETYLLGEERVDLSPMVREALVLSLPVAPLCQEDCPGPAPEDFPTNVEVEPAADQVDPRWAALDQLTFDED